MKVRHTLCITNKQRLTEDPIQCGCVRGFYCMRVSFGDFFFCHKNIIFLTLKIEFVAEYSVDPDEMPFV